MEAQQKAGLPVFCNAPLAARLAVRGRTVLRE
jgi:hypothetical protein